MTSRRISLRTAVASTLFAVMAGPAWSTSTHAFSIGATVLSAGNCRFTTAGPTALSFGTIDPSTNANATASASIQYRCNGGTALVTWNVTSDHGLHESAPGAPRMRHASLPTGYLPYSLTFAASGTVPRNTDQDLTVTGTVVPADFEDARAGDYSDSVVLTIAP